MSAHTPGPWHVQNAHEIYPDWANDHYRFIKSGKGFHDEETGQGFQLVSFISEADARLIAAAPDLLDAIEEINIKVGGLFAAMGHGLEIGEQVWDEAFAAMEKGREAARKARGEA